MEKKTALWVKILIPVLIVAVIGGIWIFKTVSEKSAEDPSSSQETADLPSNLEGADFSLIATKQINFEELAEYGLPVIADYGADSCIPCKQMAPVLKKLNTEMYGKAFIKFVDVWQYNEASSNVPVQVIPTQVLFNADGTPFVPSDELAKEIKFDMYSDKTSGKHIFTVHQGGLTEEQMRTILAEMGVK
ncbi:MAG: thioredoxin family protein [Ruminococcus sp.]|nr:thioredoxin family protein [Ruminococcus sp.]